MDRPQYINWIAREDGVVFEDQQSLNCYRLSYVIDNAILDDWALHIRRHYVSDGELEEDAALNNLPVEEYLRQFIIPQKNEPFGPTARSNDISEILFADLFEFVLNYEVPRCKQYNRSGKNESEHGTDVIAYRFFTDEKKPHKNDELVAIEVKALLSSKEAGKVIKDAVDDSKKDEHRDCFEQYVNKLTTALHKAYPQKNASSIVESVMARKSIVEAIENHLCFVFSIDENADKQSIAADICKETLAYFMANDDEKALLEEIFNIITLKTNKIDYSQIKNYARTMIGIDSLLQIEKWIAENHLTRQNYTNEQLVEMIISFFQETHTLKKGTKCFADICQM